jgi:hypothetical protein
VAGRLTSGALNWRGKAQVAPVAPAIPAAAAHAAAIPADAADNAARASEPDHVEALERWASAETGVPSWMREQSDQAPTATDGFTDAGLPKRPDPEPDASAAIPEPPPAPVFDDATDRFAIFALRAAEAQALRGDERPAFLSAPEPTSETFAATPSTTAQSLPADASPTERADSLDSVSAHPAGWRPNDVVVSAADLDADALRLEMLAARAAEGAWLRRHYDDSAMAEPTVEADSREAGWRRDTITVSAADLDADASRLEMLAARAAEWRPTAVEEPTLAEDEERVSFWRTDAAAVAPEDFDADAARLEALAARGPVFAEAPATEPVESVPFWEQQERARREAEQRADAEATAREAALTDQWHARWEQVTEQIVNCED